MTEGWVFVSSKPHLATRPLPSPRGLGGRIFPSLCAFRRAREAAEAAEVEAETDADVDADARLDKKFTFDEAVDLLKGSTAAHIAGYISFAASIGTLVINVGLVDDDSDEALTDESANATVNFEDTRS